MDARRRDPSPGRDHRSPWPAPPARGIGVLLALLLAAPAAVFAQQPEALQQEETAPWIVHEREVFFYPRGGRPDPFRSLVGTGALGMRVEELTLRGIMHDPDAQRSVAILSVTGRERPVRARVGDQIGGIRILAIHPRRVDVLVEELGVARRESLHLRVTPEQGVQ